MPRALALLMLFVLGSIIGSFINLAAYTLAWRPRAHSPWSRVPQGGPPRNWTHRLPVFGWIARRHDGKFYGRRFWIRPLAVEFLTGALFAALYQWETTRSYLHLAPQGAPRPAAEMLAENFAWVVHLRYAVHLLLFALLLIASLIDLDEKTIPDAITVPGTWLGLLLAAAFPWSLLPASEWAIAGGRATEFMTLVSPNEWRESLNGWPRVWPLLAAIGCWSLWCGGLLPRRLRLRRGWRMAVRLFWHRLIVEQVSYWLALVWLIGAACIATAAVVADTPHWAALLSALVGMAVGGGVIWLVRFVGTAALRREAMGFGDVTLISMIGAFLGWQAAVMVFFIAPFVGLATGIVQWVMHGEREIPYGPYLSLAAAGVVVGWASIWPAFADVFALEWVVGAVLGMCMVLMGLMLLVYRWLLTWLVGR